MKKQILSVMALVTLTMSSCIKAIENKVDDKIQGTSGGSWTLGSKTINVGMANRVGNGVTFSPSSLSMGTESISFQFKNTPTSNGTYSVISVDEKTMSNPWKDNEVYITVSAGMAKSYNTSSLDKKTIQVQVNGDKLTLSGSDIWAKYDDYVSGGTDSLKLSFNVNE